MDIPFNDSIYGINGVFGRFGVALKKIPIIRSITTYLDETLNLKRTVTYSIVCVLVVLFIIGLYYLIKFLYKKWKQRRNRTL